MQQRISASDAERMKQLAFQAEHGLTPEEMRRIMYPNSDDPIFPYTGSPDAQAEMIIDARGENNETDDDEKEVTGESDKNAHLGAVAIDSARQSTEKAISHLGKVAHLGGHNIQQATA